MTILSGAVSHSNVAVTETAAASNRLAMSNACATVVGLMRMSASLNSNHLVSAFKPAACAAHDLPIQPAGGGGQRSTSTRPSRCAQSCAVTAVSSSELSSATTI